MKNWGLDQIGFTVVPTLIFDMTKAKALYILCFEPMMIFELPYPLSYDNFKSII